MFRDGVPALVLCAGLAVATAPAATAEVADAAAGGFTVRIERRLAEPPDAIYRALVDRVGDWWHPDHTFGGDASRLSIDARPQGCFCEQLPSGGVRHLTVVYAEPGKRLRMAGGLGPLQDFALAGSLTVDLAAADGGTALALTYAVGGYVDGGLEDWAAAVDSVLAVQVDRLARFVAGEPPGGG